MKIKEGRHWSDDYTTDTAVWHTKHVWETHRTADQVASQTTGCLLYMMYKDKFRLQGTIATIAKVGNLLDYKIKGRGYGGLSPSEYYHGYAVMQTCWDYTAVHCYGSLTSIWSVLSALTQLYSNATTPQQWTPQQGIKKHGRGNMQIIHQATNFEDLAKNGLIILSPSSTVHPPMSLFSLEDGLTMPTNTTSNLMSHWVLISTWQWSL